MKKALSIFLILIMCFAICACAAPSDDGLDEIENPMTVYISFADAEEFLRLGADRLGTSRLIKILKNTEDGKGY